MKMQELMGYELLEKINNKELTIQEIIEDTFKIIDETEPYLHSFVYLTKENALIRAKELDKKLKQKKLKGRLSGLPLVVDDGICVKNYPTTCASKILEGYIPPFNATVIEKLVEKDSAIFIGSTNMDEFGMGCSTETSCYFATYNPWNLDYVPGGASGGSGAAVASKQTIFALGSDIGGSIRCTASFCGVVGLKPTTGLVSKFGLASYGNSLEQIGPITKCVKDCALLLQIIAGRDSLDPTTLHEKIENYFDFLEESIENKIVGIPKEFFNGDIDPSTKEVVFKAIKKLENLGIEFLEISFPNFQFALPAYFLIALSEEASNIAKFDGLRYGKMLFFDQTKDVFEVYSKTRGEKLGIEAKRRSLLGTYLLTKKYYKPFYIKAQKVRTLIKNDIQNALKQCNALISPTMPKTAFKINELIDQPLKMYDMNSLTCPANLSGLPALSIPCGFDKKQLPIGIQIIGNYLDEKSILNIGYLLEQELNIFRKMPAIKN
ncbi:MAG: Asp-tRNA(Asn)/Glu-tRNA(Gln) amidotransferase subunit GatA [Candidatus Hodarchaeota archaeon]